MQLSTPNESGAARLAGDVRTAFLLANEARHQGMARVFGVPREQETLLTWIVILMLADRAGEQLRRVLQAPGPSSASDALLGTAAVRELLYGLAGPASRDTSMIGTLLTAAVIGGAAGRALAKSVRGIRSSSRGLDIKFHHRYGYLVDPRHWRQRRAQRREAAGS